MEKEYICEAIECNQNVSLKENPIVPLDCSHFICLNYIINNLKDEEKDEQFVNINCPVCKKSHDVNIKFFQQVHQSYKNHVGVQKNKNLSQVFMCSKDNEPIKFFCQKEQIYLCMICVSSHFGHAPGNLNECDTQQIKNEFDMIYQQFNELQIIECYKELHQILEDNEQKNSEQLQKLEKQIKDYYLKQQNQNDQNNQCCSQKQVQIEEQQMMMQQLFEQIEQQNKKQDVKKSFEERKINQDQSIHKEIYCNICNCTPLVGTRYKCFKCDDFDLCQECEQKKIHEHPFIKIDQPINPGNLSLIIFQNLLELENKKNNDGQIQQNESFLTKNGLQDLQARAFEISYDSKFLELDEIQKIDYLEKEYEKQFKIVFAFQLTESRRDFFNQIFNTFKIFNPFIHNFSDQEFLNFVSQIEDKMSLEIPIESEIFQEFFIQKLSQIGFRIDKEQRMNQLIFYDHLLEKVEPKERIFIDNQVEKFLYLRDYLSCDYKYKVSQDLQKDFDKIQFSQVLQGLVIISKKIKDEQSFVLLAGKIFQDLDQSGFIIQKKQLLSIQKQNLSQLNLNEIYKSFASDKDLVKDAEKWANSLIESICFDKTQYKKLSLALLSFFKSEELIIKDRSSANENIAMHKDLDEKLKSSLFISEPAISFKKKQNEKQLTDIELQVVLDPKIEEMSAIEKWETLEQIGLKNLDWKKIVKEIIDNVESSLKVELDFESQKVQQLKENPVSLALIYHIEQLKKFIQKQVDIIQSLENKFLKKEIIGEINNELMRKLGLLMSKEMEQEFTWLTLIVFWVQICKKAEFLLVLIHEKNRDKYLKEFYDIANLNF